MAPSSQPSQQGVRAMRYVPGVLLMVATLSGCGRSSGTPSALQALDAAIERGEYRGVHAVLVAKDGQLVHESYFAGEDEHGRTGALGRVVFDRETRHDLRSVTKSVMSLLVGIALAGDTLALDRPILDFLPEHRHRAAPGWNAVRLRHVLDMTSGFAWSEAAAYADSGNDGSRMGRSADPTRFVLERPVAARPGSRWNYSGGETHLLMEVVRRVTGRDFLDYAREALFTPLGITDVEWMPYAGNDLPDADSGLRLRPFDALRLGMMVERRGMWQGRQVVPATWIAGLMRAAVATSEPLVELGADATVAIGFTRHWWHEEFDLPYGRVTAHRATGNGGQMIVVVPAARLVVMVTAGRYDQSNDSQRLIVERILPWALTGEDRAFAFPLHRAFREVRPGEWPTRALAEVERARYVGRYLYSPDTVHVWDEGGVLRMRNFAGERVEPLALVPMGEHAFAMGRYQAGTLTRIYWPDDRVIFEVDARGASGFVDRSVTGNVYGRAVRLR